MPSFFFSSTHFFTSENLRMYFTLFEDSPIPIWDEDFSEVKKWVDEKKNEGIIDFKAYLLKNPDQLEVVAGKMVVNKINKAVVSLNEGKSKEHVLSNLSQLRTKDFKNYMINQITTIANDETSCEFDAVLKTLKGNIRHVLFKWMVVKGYEETYGRIYLTTTDLTDRIVEDNIILQQSNREKETLLREIHHRVKNNFQIITSLIRLQASTINDPTMEDAMNTLLNRIFSMASVHELLYHSEKFEVININEYLSHLIQLLEDSLNSHAKIVIELDSEDIDITLDQASPFGLVLNELITNSVKHGFKNYGYGKIYIKTRLIDKTILVEIGDNGDGIDPNTPKNNDSLGLSLVESLVEQLNAKLIQVNRGKGAHYELQLPFLAYDFE